MEELDYWRLCEELSIDQAAHLIIGASPTLVQELSVTTAELPESQAMRYERDIEAVRSALTYAIRSGILPATSIEVRRKAEQSALAMYEEDDDGFCFVDTGELDLHKTTIHVTDLRDWLRLRGMKPEFFFPENNELTPDYLDPLHPRYAPKLAAAVNAWLTMEDNSLMDGKSPKQALEKWLRENAAKYGLSDDDGKPNETGIAECAKVANWKSKGGAPKTPG